MRILFLCTANVCRSPAAEHYMRHLLARFEVPSVQVESAGILEMNSAPADPVVRKEMAGRGVDLSSHGSRRATAEILAGADEIVVMEKRHRAWIREHHPDQLKKVSLIREPDAKSDLHDPSGGTIKDYRVALELLCKSIEQRVLAFKYPV